jgi:hypothetical protein
MDFFGRTKLCPLLSYLLPYSRTFNCTSKTAGWFTKRAEIDPTCPTLTKVLPVAHAFLYTLMDLFSRTKLCPSRCYLTFFHIPNVQFALVNYWFTKRSWNWSNLPHANKSVTQGTRTYIHWWTSLSRTKCAQAVAILPSSIFPNVHSKTTGWFTKELKLIPTCPTLKVLLQGSTRILIYID